MALSDHDAQISRLKSIHIHATISTFSLKQRTKLIENETIVNSQALLKRETLESVYIDTDPNQMINSFLGDFLTSSKLVIQLNTKVWKTRMIRLHKE